MNNYFKEKTKEMFEAISIAEDAKLLLNEELTLDETITIVSTKLKEVARDQRHACYDEVSTLYVSHTSKDFSLRIADQVLNAVHNAKIKNK